MKDTIIFVPDSSRHFFQLSEEEAISYLTRIEEDHIVPDYKNVLKKGFTGLLQEVKETGMRAGTKEVMTNLFKKRPVTAIVTESKSGSRRLFLCTASPEQLHFDTNCSGIGKSLRYAETNRSLLPLTIYALRWHIETAYYEQKKFWAFGNYMLRSRDGIECLLNLLTLVYSLMSLLPFLDSSFSFLTDVSPQQARFLLSCQIHQDLFFDAFVRHLKHIKNTLSHHATSIPCSISS